MTQQPSSPTDSRALRQQFLAHAGAAFDLLFHPDHQPDLVSFDQRETRVLEVIRDLGMWVLQQQVNADPAARPCPGQAVCCPQCRRPAARVTGPPENLLCRKLTTLLGEVELKRQQWRCKACRVLFFPPR